jgi:putative hydrolase of the HAD superfamily
VSRAVLLDAMGTLIELEPPAPRLAAALGVPLEAAERAIAAEIACYRANMLSGRDPASLAALRRRCADVVGDELGLDGDLTGALVSSLRFRAHPDAPPALRALRAAGVRLVVASNWDVSLPETLDSAGLLSLLDGVVTSAGCGAAKPSAVPFRAALAVAGVGAAEAIHVGDSLAEDVAGARAAGIEPVLVVRGQRAPDLAEASGVRTIRSLAELPGLLAFSARAPNLRAR